MKLSINTYNAGKDLTVEELIEISKKYGYAGIEFRTGMGHKHGVELEATSEKLKEIRIMLEDAYLVTASVASGCRFESPDENIRKENVETAKRHAELAYKLDCSRIRVFGNVFREGVDRDVHIGWVGEALKEIGDFARPYGVEVLLEMHQDFNFWKYAVKSVELAGIPNAGIVYNCDNLDIIGGSIAVTYNNIKRHIRHIHSHCVLLGYPYKELFELLKKDGYEGFVSAEIDEKTCEPDKLLGYYAAVMRSTLMSINN